MPTESAGAVVFGMDRKQVVLLKREDFRVWVTPGGGIEDGESPEDAAIRETFEETGYRVAIDRLIGRYWHPQAPQGGDLVYLFEAYIVGGEPIKNGAETLDVRFFPVDQLPPKTWRWTRTHLADALVRNGNIIERTEVMPIGLAVLIRVGIALRDFRNQYILRRR